MKNIGCDGGTALHAVDPVCCRQRSNIHKNENPKRQKKTQKTGFINCILSLPKRSEADRS